MGVGGAPSTNAEVLAQLPPALGPEEEVEEVAFPPDGGPSTISNQLYSTVQLEVGSSNFRGYSWDLCSANLPLCFYQMSWPSPEGLPCLLRRASGTQTEDPCTQWPGH